MIKIFTATNSNGNWIRSLEDGVNAFEQRDDIIVTGREVAQSTALSETATHERMTIIVTYRIVRDDAYVHVTEQRRELDR